MRTPFEPRRRHDRRLGGFLPRQVGAVLAETLAVRRGTAVIKELTGQAGFEPSRATAGEIERVPDTQTDSVPTKLELGALERMEKPRQ